MSPTNRTLRVAITAAAGLAICPLAGSGVAGARGGEPRVTTPVSHNPTPGPTAAPPAADQIDPASAARAAAFLARLRPDASQPPGTAPAPDAPSPAPPAAPTGTASPPPKLPGQGDAGARVGDRPEGMAPSAQNAPLADEMTPELDQAVTRGLAWLAAQQRPDGSFGGGRLGPNVAITSLACLAFMSDGHVPGRGQYGEVVRKGLEYVLANSTETGLLAADGASGPMYGHGFAALFLGEIYGMTAGGADTRLHDRVHDALVRACRLIERTQNEEGGWRYNPVPFDADVSVTICQVMALRSARNAGLEIPKQTIDRAVDYVRRCQNPDGGFRYMSDPGTSLWPRSGAGVATLYYAGIYQDQALDKGVGYLLRNALPTSPTRQDVHFFYGVYYVGQAMYLSGGDAWARWWPATREELLRRRSDNGSWPDPQYGNNYGTSMALIVLQFPKRYLPIFQK